MREIPTSDVTQAPAAVVLAAGNANSIAHKEKWLGYMESRRGSYEFRARTRYKAVADRLIQYGLSDGDLVMDVGAGTTQFDHYLRTELGWRGRYLPVDAVLDGTDLEVWTPQVAPTYAVCIEVVEHLKNPYRMLDILENHVERCAVITTPNPAAVDVIQCDPTHVSQVSLDQLWQRGWRAEARSFFNKPEDTILASYSNI